MHVKWSVIAKFALLPSFLRFLLTFSTSAYSIQSVEIRWRPRSDLTMFLIRGSFLHGRKRMYMFSSLKFSLLNQFSVVEWKLNSALYGWPEPYTRRKDFKVFLDSIVRESLHCFSFAFLSDTNDNFVTKSTAGHGLPRDCRMSQVITVGCMQFQTTTFGHKLWWRRVI